MELVFSAIDTFKAQIEELYFLMIGVGAILWGLRHLVRKFRI